MIRQLRPGERVPPGEPARYRSGHGYIRLRWRIGNGDYVEAYEHRIIDGRATTAEQVHHRNEVKDDNRPENLAHVTAAEHRREHRLIDRQEAISRYEAGESLPTIAQAMQCDPGQLSRLLRDEGVVMRAKRDYYPSIERDALAAAMKPGARAPQLAELFGVSVPTIYRWIREHELPRLPTGRPRSTT